jgi:hypothetical protein
MRGRHVRSKSDTRPSETGCFEGKKRLFGPGPGGLEEEEEVGDGELCEGGK